MTRPVPPPPTAPDEADREFVREMIATAEATGGFASAWPIVTEALYAAWKTIDRLRAAQPGEERGL